jgi:hypothetical protein
MLFCSVMAVATVVIIITMNVKVMNGVGTTAATMPGAQKSINAASSRWRLTSNWHLRRTCTPYLTRDWHWGLGHTTRCTVGGGTRLPCPTLLRLRMNPSGYCLLFNTHISLSGHLLVSKQPTYLVTTKLGQTQQYTLLIAITLAMSSAPWESS